MPEGVEVKLSAESIKPLVVGKLLRRIVSGGASRYKNDSPKGMKEFLASFRDESGPINIVNECRIIDVQTRGKFMYWTFSNGWYMFCTFGMSGQWSPEAGKHVCLEVKLIDKSGIQPSVFFNDPRHFGTIQFVEGNDALLLKLNELGWDPLNDGLQVSWLDYVFNTVLQKTKKTIGQVLMDQNVFAGVGNYIRAEALYVAKMSPWCISKDITRPQFDALAKAVVDVMNDSYKHQGATILTYKDAYGAEGKYSSCFKVYGQKKDPNGYPIVKEETPDKRTIHWCPSIQDPLNNPIK